ncbi:elastase [Culex quinquefasciatus]|uniref:Elastase n=1 Tax=Culex quinquefasciatus TaxID=7176 RepID=B0WMT0_CULQU|nr:elastase [Culex quinquefasciatus]|eukprot:XP_001850014.1 elastase [Culex quinquefasciatus]
MSLTVFAPTGWIFSILLLSAVKQMVRYGQSVARASDSGLRKALNSIYHTPRWDWAPSGWLLAVPHFQCNVSFELNVFCAMNFTVALLLTIVVAVAQLFKVIDSQQCGARKVTINEVIVRGWDTVPGSFPWHGAIYHRKGRSDSYACGGTLLNARFVMTADHCVKDDNGFVLSPKRIIVRLGLNNLNAPNLRNTQQHEVLTIHRVPEANGKKNDVALLELSTEAQFDEFVQPACVNQEPAITGLLGTAVGWGFTESDELSPVLKATRMPVVDTSQCIESNRDTFGLALDSTLFCAGYTNGSTAVCNGDSGGGLHVKRGSAWFVVGIISFTTPFTMPTVICVGLTATRPSRTWSLAWLTDI